MTVAGKPILFLATAKPQESIEFYRDVLGLELIEDSIFAIVFADNGHMLRIQRVPDHTPAGYTVHGWDVPDIAAQIDILAAKGVKFSVFPGLAQADNGVWTAPDGTKVAWFSDPTGNILSLTQFTN
jgi:catechol 2,3-dioxygenase-like lactoylglutathione lyase family enzyme